MRVSEHDRSGVQALKFSQPIKTAIDHHFCTAIRNQQRSVHAMAPCAHVDLAARAYELQFHRESLVFFSQSPVIYCRGGSARQNFGSSAQVMEREKEELTVASERRSKF